MNIHEYESYKNTLGYQKPINNLNNNFLIRKLSFLGKKYDRKCFFKYTILFVVYYFVIDLLTQKFISKNLYSFENRIILSHKIHFIKFSKIKIFKLNFCLLRSIFKLNLNSMKIHIDYEGYPNFIVN